MLTLEDGTPMHLTQEGLDFFLTHVKPAVRAGQAVLTVEGHVSQSTGRVATVALNLCYDYEEMVKNAIRTVRDKKPEDCDTSEIPLEVWKNARRDVLASLAESVVGGHSKGAGKRGSLPIDADLSHVLVGVKNGHIQLRGAITGFELEVAGEAKPRKSAALTLAKRYYEEGTYRERDKIGSIVTLSLRGGGFRRLSLGDVHLEHTHFAAPEPEPAEAEQQHGFKRPASIEESD